MDKKGSDRYKRIIFLGILTLLIITIIPTLISANMFTNFVDSITGRATSASTTASITISVLESPNVSIVSLNSTEAITAGATREIEFSAIINDTNGDMNVSNGSVTANITSAGTTSFNNSCILVLGNSSGGNWTCTVNITFFAPPGDWKVSVQATDNSSRATNNATRFFTLQTTTAMNMTVNALTFATSAPATVNVTASNNPNKVQNIGNKVYLNVSVTGINLLGDTNSNFQISANNFTVRNETGSYVECGNTSLLGASLVNTTAINIEGANTSRGLVAQVSLYFCLVKTPTNLTSQTYSTGGSPDEDDWTVAVS